MPTINLYQGGGGYYIRARPSDATGTITYKIRSYGNPVVREMGFRDGEEITWDSIDALKSLGIVYTEGSGTVKPDNFDSDPDLLQKHSISEKQARRMFAAVRKHLEVEEKQLEAAANALGTSYHPDESECQSGSATDTETESSEQESSTGVKTGGYPLVDSSVSSGELESGKRYAGIIDRMSNSGNGIIELRDGFINIGRCQPPDVGERVVFVYSTKQICKAIAGLSQPNSVDKNLHDGGHLTAKDKNLLDKL